MKNKLNQLFFLLIFIILLETIYNLTTQNSFNLSNFLITLVFTLNAAIFFILILKLFSPQKNKVVFYILIFLLTFYYYGQFIFYEIFKMPFSFSSISLASQALDFKSIIISTLKNNILNSIYYFLPLLLIFLFSKKINYVKSNIKGYLYLVASYFLSIALCITLLLINNNSTYSIYNLYFNNSSLSLQIEKFGLLTATKLDLASLIFNRNTKITLPTKKEKKEEIEYNQENINFEQIPTNNDDEIKQLNDYFQNEQATNKNKYTGIYKDKNLIFILAEGFNSLAVDKDLTPTLYKMVNSSFVFNNFYSPLFLSTTGGEFQATTGLLPTQETLKAWKQNLPYLKYSYGHIFAKNNYYTSAFHNWTYTYYNRDKTMLTQGFTNFLGCKNGLEKEMNCNTWPTSDIELIDVTTPKYINKEKFMTFYITVSGHAEYNWQGNAIARKNKELTQNLPYSEAIQAYMATQIELDRALELLLARLEEQNILQDTVIALVGDHYPYTLSAETINEKSDIKRDEKWEVHRSNFILYNSETKKHEVNKYASNLDVLPTLLNLFQIDFDSRLIMGKDIFSDEEGLVIFSDHSWISDQGKYDVNSDIFTPFKENINDDYVENINSKVANKFAISNLLIQKNYYKIISESGN